MTIKDTQGQLLLLDWPYKSITSC